MKVHPILDAPVTEQEVQEINKEPFPIPQEQLKENLANFTVDIPQFTNQADTSNLIHPFSCKVVGPRGSGKTSFAISYIQKIACLTFKEIFIVTASQDQPLYELLKDNSQIFFITLDELGLVIKTHKDILIVLDDVMQEVRFNHTLETVFTRGRHQRISIMSLEQDLFYSNHIERRNADYFIIMRMRDTSSLIQFYKRFCSDIQQWRFIDVYGYAVEKPLGYLILDLVSYKYKYRVNSLNQYFNCNTNKIECIDKAFNVTSCKEANTQLQARFKLSLYNLKSGISSFDTPCITKEEIAPEVVAESHAKETPAEKVLEPVKPSYVCNICFEDYYQEDALTIHRVLDHKDEEAADSDDDDL
jgi:Poxvirus A32 protein